MNQTHEADVLIIGEGIAGCCAAIEAHDLGARDLVVDKAPKGVPHGNTVYSGGAFRRVSDTYTRGEYFRDLMVLSGNRADPDLANFVVDRSAEAQHWLERLGVVWIELKESTGAVVEAEDRGRGIVQAVRRAVEARGVRSMHETEASALPSSGGRVIGIDARRADGTMI